MIRRIFSRRSFFGLLGAAPLAVPAVLLAAAEPVVAGADVSAYPAAVTSVYRDWQSVVAQIRAEEAAAAAMQLSLSRRTASTAITASLDHTVEQITMAKKVLAA